MSIKIETGLNMNNAEGDVQAGLAIHRLGDLYAHTEIVTGSPSYQLSGIFLKGNYPIKSL